MSAPENNEQQEGWDEIFEGCKLAHCCECCEFWECPSNWSYEIEEFEDECEFK